ncbi:hypothetical protein RhiirA1_475471 [Rhizophagus irregularis]|uniref:Uncharacterized protein n=1 Tax=Rhizophagus irregularis TaxID=588596 RepID=A0A2N0QWS1_9GLOM|nr:hypothetical protein RhiirA1_475471 [Rhizophagus irregularis]
MIKHFWNGSITVFGIKRRFEHRNNCINESDEEIRNDFSNFVINTTYENGSAANSVDVRIRKIDKIDNEKVINGHASLSLRILFEYFQPQLIDGNLFFTVLIHFANVQMFRVVYVGARNNF